MAGRGDEKLRALLADVTVDDAGRRATLGDLADSEPKPGLNDPDEVPEPPEEPYVKPGDLSAWTTTGSCAATPRMGRTSTG